MFYLASITNIVLLFYLMGLCISLIEKSEVTKLYSTEVIVKSIKTREYKEKFVNLDTTMAACKQCPNYSKNWACPEFDTDVLRYWDEYENIELILTKIIFTQEALDATYELEDLRTIVDNSLFNERNRLITRLEEEEKQKNGKCLSAGYCGYCERCARMDNFACRYPDKCHNSIESIGGLVADTLGEVFGEELKWINEEGRLPENLSLLMAVMY